MSVAVPEVHIRAVSTASPAVLVHGWTETLALVVTGNTVCPCLSLFPTVCLPDLFMPYMCGVKSNGALI